MRSAFAASTVSLVLATAPLLTGATLRVPQDFPTIQGAIDHAQNGDTVLVDPGTYVETLLVHQDLAIVLASTRGPAVTTIRGNVPYHPTVTLNGGASTLEGFTITGGANSGVVAISNDPANGVTIRGNVITGNAHGSGGGINLQGSGTIANNLISENNVELAPNIGGGIACVAPLGTLIVIRGNVIVNNEAQAGGGVFCYGGFTAPLSGQVRLQNNVIAGNTAKVGYLNVDGYGGGVFAPTMDPSFVEMTNNTVTHNRAEHGAGLSGVASIENSILWFNETLLGGADVDPGCQITYSNVEGGFPGAGNIDADPLFVDQYHLSAASPCVDEGRPHFVPDQGAEFDVEGNSRLLDGHLAGVGAPVDMGAYEFTHVRLDITGTATPGGTLSIATTGTPGLTTVLLIALQQGTVWAPPFGYLGFDPTTGFFLVPWPGAPSIVDVTIPPGVPSGTSVVLQEIALAAPAIGNASNPVGVTVH